MGLGGERGATRWATESDHLQFPLSDGRTHRQRLGWLGRRRNQQIAVGAALAVAAAAIVTYSELRSPDTLITQALPTPTSSADSSAAPTRQPSPDASGKPGASAVAAARASSSPTHAAASPSGLPSGAAVLGAEGVSGNRPAGTPSPAKGSTSGTNGATIGGTSNATKPSSSGAVKLGAKPALAAASGRAASMYGQPLSGLPWHSGFWTGGNIDAVHIASAGAWRGRTMDFATVYPKYATWDEISTSSPPLIAGFAGYKGHLAYGLPLLPTDRKGDWTDVTSGANDAVFSSIAKDLVKYGQGDAAIRMGPEANGYWFPWSAGSTNYADFKTAFRHIVTVMRASAPKLTFWLDLNCGTQMQGTTSRLDALSLMYPGDDVVDGVSMDIYDAYSLAASDDAAWNRALTPPYGPGLSDGVTFARAHHKGFAVPEWGLHATKGSGDNPFFIQRMFDFFVKNKDVLVYENYFNEPDPYIANALFEGTNNPKSAALYLTLWGKKP